MLEVIELMTCFRSSMRSPYLSTIDIIVSILSRVMHATIGIRAYQFRLQKMVSELVVFVQDSTALDEEDVKSIEFGGDIKMKKKTRKFIFVLR